MKFCLYMKLEGLGSTLLSKESIYSSSRWFVILTHTAILRTSSLNVKLEGIHVEFSHIRCITIVSFKENSETIQIKKISIEQSTTPITLNPTKWLWHIIPFHPRNELCHFNIFVIHIFLLRNFTFSVFQFYLSS
jgi:hypothetical protein